MDTRIGKPKQFSMFGKLTEDRDETILAEGLCEVDAKSMFREKRDALRGQGFHVNETKDSADGTPLLIVINPVSGKQECQYWISETA